jgi:uncharacterized OB-fold protein
MSKRFFPDSMPPPLADMNTLAWWEAAAQHRLVVQRCTACRHMRHPPAPICPECRCAASDWHELSGRGEVYTYTIVHRPIAAGQTLPFVVAVIALEGADGLRMISNLVDMDLREPAIGMPVEIVWEDMSDDLAIPRFRPIGQP